MTIQLSGSVGAGGVNEPADVVVVQQRLISLGFDFFGLADGNNSPKLERTIRLFQSIIASASKVQGDGRVDVDHNTIAFLRASNAPRWQLMPMQGAGFVNHDRQHTGGVHAYGTNWMADAIIGIGRHYQRQYRANHPRASLLEINDVSTVHGGFAPPHTGHQTGMSCDVRLPRLDGHSGGVTFMDPAYDQDAARGILAAMRSVPEIRLVLFNDPTLVSENLCTRYDGHDNHIHFAIRAPAPQP